MFSYALIVWLLLFQAPAPPPVQGDVGGVLARAEQLYYDAKFEESIALLLPVDAALKAQPGRATDKINVKLALAVAYIGLNDNARAKNQFSEIIDLDPSYAPSPQRYGPKVATSFDEAKAERTERRCRAFCDAASRELSSGNLKAIFDATASPNSGCGCLAPVMSDAAEYVFRQGIDAYKDEDYAGALEKFRTTLKLDPKHAVAPQYIELTQGKLLLAAEQVFFEWRRNFEAREYGLAALAYHRMRYFDAEGAASRLISQMRGEYAKTLSGYLDAWKRACSVADNATMERTRRQAEEMLPDPAIGESVLAQMTGCVNKTCIQMDSQSALARRKIWSRPENEIPRQFQSLLKNPENRMVYVRTRIDTEGNAAVLLTQGHNASINDAVKAAVSKWKFSPLIVDNQPRCVEADLQIGLSAP